MDFRAWLLFRRWTGALVFFWASFELEAQQANTNLMQTLAAQGVPAERVLGVDAKGIPVLCGTDGARLSTARKTTVQASGSELPAGTRGWECIPCVIRYDGVESFRLEANVNSAVNAVTFNCALNLIPASGGTLQTLRDDGLGGDRVARDFIYTSVSMVANTNWPMENFIGADTNSPYGLTFVELGSVDIQETTGQTSRFLIFPQVGFLRPGIPTRPATLLSSNVAASAHLLNIRSAEQRSQKCLLQISWDIHSMIQEMYGAIPDLFDFLMFFSTDHLEWLPYTAEPNFNCGIHSPVQINYTGIGLQPFNNSGDVGSKGRLLGLNFLDTNQRGVFSANATHEIIHQWLIFTSPYLGLNEDGPHFNCRSSAASLLGGQQWVPAGNSYILNCQEGRNGAHFAPPLDKYMMGLIEGSNVPPVLFYRSDLPPPGRLCGEAIDADHSITIGQIQQEHGVRSPGPATAQKEFFIGFVAETHNRLFTLTEMTFYDILAEHYTKPLPADAPAPYVGPNWAPMTRFFGEGTTWHSGVLSELQPTFTSIAADGTNNIQLSGVGIPGVTYTLQSSPNLVNWTNSDTVTPATNRTFQVVNSFNAGRKFYRLVWP